MLDLKDIWYIGISIFTIALSYFKNLADANLKMAGSALNHFVSNLDSCSSWNH
jgi:hypothetical protein